MKRIAGIDGCRAGWFVVHGAASLGTPAWFVAATFAEAVARLDDCAIIGVDMPIGIPDAGPRQCERLARLKLAPHRSASVFPVPIRPIFGIRDYREACDRREAIDGKRMSAQAFNIMPKIEQVDTVLQSVPSLRARLFEIHPELAFTALSGSPMRMPKRTSSGLSDRLTHLAQLFPQAQIEEAMAAYPRQDVSRDDVLDAFAVMASARNILNGNARRLPLEPEYDSRGLDMAIWF